MGVLPVPLRAGEKTGPWVLSWGGSDCLQISALRRDGRHGDFRSTRRRGRLSELQRETARSPRVMEASATPFTRDRR